MTSGEFLKHLRNKQKLSLRALGFLSGVSHTQISDLEKNINFGSVEKLEKILSSLNATQEEIEHYYFLRDCEKTPDNIINKLNKLKDENTNLKNQINISNNSNNGDIVVGNNNKNQSINSDIDLSGLDEADIQQIKTYIAFIKAQKMQK